MDGDAFVVLCRGVESEAAAVVAAERLLAALTAPLARHQRELVVTASIGVVVPEGPGLLSEDVVRDADVAMRRAKQRFPIDGLKVDRSFVAGITEGPQDRHILAAIVQMAKGLGLEVVAEGVETLEQARWVRELGCDVAQGYLFAAPTAAAALEPLLRQGLPTSRLSAVFDVPAPAAADAAAERAPDEQTVTLGAADEAPGLSTSTLRRWADGGRIRAVRTTGGHRRFPVSELQRLRSASALLATPVLRLTPWPAEALPRLATLLVQTAPR